MSTAEICQAAEAADKRRVLTPQHHNIDTAEPLGRPLLRHSGVQLLQPRCPAGVVRREIQTAEAQITVSVDLGDAASTERPVSPKDFRGPLYLSAVPAERKHPPVQTYLLSDDCSAEN